jgi:hypothetical protein
VHEAGQAEDAEDDEWDGADAWHPGALRAGERHDLPRQVGSGGAVRGGKAQRVQAPGLASRPT